MAGRNHFQILDSNFLLTLDTGVLRFGATTIAKSCGLLQVSLVGRQPA